MSKLSLSTFSKSLAASAISVLFAASIGHSFANNDLPDLGTAAVNTFSLENESELASVLAHEITHVTQRHLARSLEAQQKSSTATIVGMLGAILLTIAAPQAGMAALATTQALATQSKINYTRLHEKEADRIGMQILVDAGFDPNAAAPTAVFDAPVVLASKET